MWACFQCNRYEKYACKCKSGFLRGLRHKKAIFAAQLLLWDGQRLAKKKAPHKQAGPVGRGAGLPPPRRALRFLREVAFEYLAKGIGGADAALHQAGDFI